MAQNDIYLVRESSDGTFEEIANSPFQYDAANATDSPDKANNTFHINTKLRVDELEVNGDTTVIHTDSNTTEQLSVTNDGTGPAAIINQIGAEPLIDIQDDGVSALYIEDGGNVGIGNTSPNEKLRVTAGSNLRIMGFEAPLNGSTNQLIARLMGETNGSNFTDSKISFDMASKDGTVYEPTLTLLSGGGVTIGSNGGVSQWGTFQVNNSTGDGTPTIDAWNQSTNSENAHAIIRTAVKPGGGDAYYRAVVDGELEWSFGLDSSDENKFKINSSGELGNALDRLTITSTGNVGIGTESPFSLLTVQDKASNVQLEVDPDADRVLISSYNRTGTSAPQPLKFSASTFNFIDGNVGIGTTSPDSSLHIEGSDNATSQLHLKNTAFSSDPADFLITPVYSSNQLQIRNSSAVSILAINGDGNVGIGTTDPASKLHVDGDTRIDGNLIFDPDGHTSYLIPGQVSTVFRNHLNSASLVTILNDGNVGIGITSPSLAKLQIEGDSDVTRAGLLISDVSGRASAIHQKGSILKFDDFTQGLTTMVIDGLSGNVGIGTTSPSSKLQIHSDTAVSQTFAVTTLSGTTAISHASMGHGTNKIGNLQLGNASGNLKVFLTSGGASYINGGNVGIGTSTPSATLDVNGDINFTGDLYKNGVVFSGGGGGSSGAGGTSFGGGSASNSFPNPLDVSGDTSSGVSLTINSTYDDGTGNAGGAGNNWRFQSDGDGSFRIGAQGSSFLPMFELMPDGSNGTNAASTASGCKLSVQQLTTVPGSGADFEFVNRGNGVDENGHGFSFWPSTGAGGPMLTIGADQTPGYYQCPPGVKIMSSLHIAGKHQHAPGTSYNQNDTELKSLDWIGHKSTYYGVCRFDLTDPDPSNDVYYFHLVFRGAGTGIKYKVEIASTRKSTSSNSVQNLNSGYLTDESFAYFEDDLDYFGHTQFLGSMESVGDIEIIERTVYPTRESDGPLWGMQASPGSSDLTADNQANYIVRYAIKFNRAIQPNDQASISSDQEGAFKVQLEVMTAGENNSTLANNPHFMNVPTSTAAADITGLAYDPSPSTANRMHFGWNDVPGAGRTYRIQVATDSGFTNLVHSVASYGAAQESVSGLTANTTYYVRVKANPIAGESMESLNWATMSATTKT